MTSTVMPTAGIARRKAPSAGILLMPFMACAIAAQSDSRADAAPSAASRAVTLITGDRVIISGGNKPSISVQPRKGREKIVFATTYQRVTAGQREHLFVIPADAQPLVGADRLDRQLFDVTALLEGSCDDARRGKLSLLVTYTSRVSALSMTHTSLPGTTITSRFKSVNGVAVSVDMQQLARLWDALTSSAANSPIRKIWLNRIYKVLPDQTMPHLAAQPAEQSGSGGAAVRVGIIGTGLAGRLASDADLITFKACAPTISGEESCTLSRVLEGMQWTVAQGARIVSMSLSQPDDPDETDPLEEAEKQLTTQYGVLFATPPVAGAAAMLLRRHPHWSPAQLKSALLSTDVHAALATSIISDTSSLNLGVAKFPHEDDPRITRTITYRNVGDTSTWLKFDIDVHGPDGTPAPAGMFSLDRTTLVVPAGSTARITLTANTQVPAESGLFSGKLLATGGGMSLTIPLALEREKPAYNLTLKHIDRNGTPALDFVTTFVRLDEYMKPIPVTDTVRLPAGRYTVQTYFYKDPVTLLVYPEFVLNDHITLTLDARDATPLSIAPPAATARRFFLRTEYQAAAGWGSHAFGLQSYSDDVVFYTGMVGRPAVHIHSYVNEHWMDDASRYTAVFTEPGTLITGIKTVPVAEMSSVRARYAMSSPDPIGSGGHAIGVDVPGTNQIHAAFSAGVKLAQARTEYYYSADEDVRWYSAMFPNVYLRLDAPSSRYIPRRTYVSNWNEPPFAPVLPNDNPEVAWAYRTGNTMSLAIPILGDRSRHVISLPLDDDTGGKLALYRNGEQIAQHVSGSTGDFRLQAVVSPEPATYRIEADATQQLLALSPRVRGVWTFRSEHVAAGTTEQLPLLSVLFNPSLNELGEAARGTEFRIPVSVYQLDQQGPAQVNDLSIEASFDDGMSWTNLPVSRDSGEWIAVLQHPQHAQYVSLRASVTGLSANTAEITLIRAYALTAGRAAGFER